MTNIKALYVHIPFCHTICGYCDFTRFGYHESKADEYLRVLKERLSTLEVTETLYIGGGTPTALSILQLKQLMSMLRPWLETSVEKTIEANPDHLTKEKMILLKQHGINRISLGVQSTHNDMLKKIGRTHTFETVVETVENLREVGFDNISMDFIYGLPNQTLEDVAQDLENLCKLNPQHLSLYALTIEPNSAFGIQGMKPASSELETEMYELIVKTLLNKGYIHYEIANFCKPGYESAHNMHYWQYHDFYGVGVGASGKENHTRYTWTKNIQEYLSDKQSYDEYLNLSQEDEMFEMVMMGLRTSHGINLKDFHSRFNQSLTEVFGNKLAKHIDQNLLIQDKHVLRTSAQGRLMLHDILVDLF